MVLKLHVREKHAVPVELQPQLQAEQSNGPHWPLTQSCPNAQVPQESEPPHPSLTLPHVAPTEAQVNLVQHAWFAQTWFDAHCWQVAPEAPQEVLVFPGWHPSVGSKHPGVQG